MNVENADFINYGVFEINKNEIYNDETTIVATGVGRSGTSMIAKILLELNVPMGSTGGLAVYEDQEIHDAILYFRTEKLHKIIYQRNERYKMWGFKFASLQNHLFPDQIGYFRNPRIIIILRDPISIALRSDKSDLMKLDFKEILLNAAYQNTSMIEFAYKINCPVLFISYEKSLNFPKEIISRISQFCGIDITQYDINNLVSCISPNNQKYISTFHTKYIGHVDGVKDGQILGWCAEKNSKIPVEVELMHGEFSVGRFNADIYREDLHKAGINNGFHSFVIPEYLVKSLSKEKNIVIKPVLDSRPLDGSYKLDDL